MGLTDEDLAPTRANLVELEENMELVEKGKDQLEQVQQQLINEFMDLFEKWQEEVEDVSDQYDAAKRKSDMARAMDGDIAVKGAASAQSETIEIESSIRNIGGVEVPQFVSSGAERNLDDRGYGIMGTSSRIDETASAYEELVDQIVKIAEIETAMTRILEEIKKIKRRVNSFEYKILPTMREEQRKIERALMEKEREEIYTLKKIKDKKEEEEEDEKDDDESYYGLN